MADLWRLFLTHAFESEPASLACSVRGHARAPRLLPQTDAAWGRLGLIIALVNALLLLGGLALEIGARSYVPPVEGEGVGFFFPPLV